MQVQLKEGIAKGVEQRKTQLKKQEDEFKKSRNKMAQLEKSLKVSAENINKPMQRLSA